MKFTIGDSPEEITFMSHILLEDSVVATTVAKTKLWLDNETLEANLTINGIEVPAEHLESFINSLWERAVSSAKEKYNGDEFEQRVEERANQLLKDHADNALEQLYDLTQKLENIGDVLTPSWER